MAQQVRFAAAAKITTAPIGGRDASGFFEREEAVNVLMGKAESINKVDDELYEDQFGGGRY